MILCLTALLATFFGPAAPRHETDTSYSRLRLQAGEVPAADWQLRFDLHDLDRVFRLDADRDGFVQIEEVQEGLPSILEALSAGITCTLDERTVQLAPEGQDLIDDPSGSLFLELRQTIVLEQLPQRVGTRVAIFDRFGEWHRHFATLELDDEMHQELLTQERSTVSVELESTVPGATRLGRRLLGGMSSVLLGIDHLLFALALVLIARMRNELLVPLIGWASAAMAMVWLGTLELPWLGTRLLEAGAALSVVYVAAENIVSPAPQQRLPVAALFGVVHGGAIGRALLESGLSDFGRRWAVAGWWIGAALGLLGLVLIGSVLGQRWRPPPRRVAVTLSALIAAAGCAIFVTRFFGT